MGLFDIFKKPTLESTVKTMCDAYNLTIGKRYSPKDGLIEAFNAIENRNQYLRSLGAENYLSRVYKEEFENLSNDPKRARKFVKKAMTEIITEYLSAEYSSLNSGLNEEFEVTGVREHKVNAMLEEQLD